MKQFIDIDMDFVRVGVVAIVTRCAMSMVTSSVPTMKQMSPCRRRMCVYTAKDASMWRDARRRQR